MECRGYVFVGIAGESLSNRTTSRLGTGLYRSPIDALGTWEDLSPRLGEQPEVRAITASPNDPDTVYVGTQWGVHRTTDRGETWELLSAPPPEFGVWSLAVSAAPEVVIAGYDPNTIQVSTDGGRTWRAAAMPASYPPGASHEPKRIMGLACDPADRQRIYAAVEAGGVLRSDDGGRSFVAAALSDDVDLLDLHGVVVTGAGAIAVGRDGIFVSTDGGRSFAHALDDSFQLEGIAPAELEAIVAEVSRARFADNLCVRRVETIATGGGTALRCALGARHASRADYGEAFDARALGARRNGEGRERPAACWHAVAAVIEACYRRQDQLTVTTSFARFTNLTSFRAAVTPAAWQPCDCNQPGGSDRASEIRAALGWLMVEQYCRSVAIAAPGRGDGSELVYVGAGASWLAEHGTIYRSRDGGRSFEPLALPDGIASTVFGISLAPGEPRRVAAATKQGQVLLSIDGGDHWQVSQLPAEAHPVYALCVI
jgi:photosystem II stability/assembly factor-like uncharacterized protein